jgi:hypothetical protein
MNHIKCNLDVTQKPYYDTDCDIYVGDDGLMLQMNIIDIDEDTEDWTGAPVAT